MKPESIRFLHQIKERAGHIPDVMSLVNSIFYEEGHASEILERTTAVTCSSQDFWDTKGHPEILERTTGVTCPSCGADWLQMEKDLIAPLEWVQWDSNAQGIPPSGFMGKSERKLAAEILCIKCGECFQQFKHLLKSL